MKINNTATSEEWLAQRLELLRKEKEFAKLTDELSAARQALPAVKVETEYVFTGEHGPVSLLELFGVHEQLIVQHFMFGPDADEGCPMCSFWADGYNPMIVHMNARDAAFAAVSRGPIDKLLSYRDRMGWDFTWVSSAENSFNFDYNVSATDAEMSAGKTHYNYQESSPMSQEMPGTSIFCRDGDAIYHTYSSYSRGMDRMNAAYAYIDLLPKGRNEQDLPFPMAWVKRNDSY